ncbi:MAG TPA: PAS domain-containing protein, partial [Thermodesulfobacteriota bacterium]|nr:PAS domain-containing protein [Thermodesulfobacteriota bacterium]
MRDEGKTKEQLMDELVELRQRIAEMEASEAEIKKVGEALRKSEARLAAAQRISHIGSWEWDIIKNELNWSDEVYRIFGLEPYEFGATYDTFIESVHPGDRETVKKYVNEALYKKRPYGIDHRIVLPDGTERIVHEQAEVIYDEAGRSIRMIGTVQDITESKRLEEELDKMEAQLRHAQKIEAIGQLAGGVAHDFNNLMTVIQGNTDLALMKIGEEEPVHRNLKEIGRVTAKAAALTRQLLTFSRRQPVSKEILNINKAVLEMSRMLQRLIGENISLSTELSPDLWNTEADPGQLEQLLMNLVVNAR